MPKFEKPMFQSFQKKSYRFIQRIVTDEFLQRRARPAEERFATDAADATKVDAFCNVAADDAEFLQGGGGRYFFS